MKKNSTIQLVLAVAFLCTLFSCTYHRRHRHFTDVTISESSGTYRLRADYNEDNTQKVQRYINRCIEPNGLFSSTEDYFDANTELKDHTKFYIKASPGKLLIKINKGENDYESYARIKNMCEGIATILKKE